MVNKVNKVDHESQNNNYLRHNDTMTNDLLIDQVKK
jgi:hypothetical protein